MGVTEHLVDRFPELTPAELVERFVPPKRFSATRFDTYRPDPEHPSQAAALAEMEQFAADVAAVPATRGRWRRRTSPPDTEARAPARYLDGGYGVGKTHLLASVWHASPGPKAYLTFADLTAAIGFFGMDEAVAAFSDYRLLCIDEFELDDVANTLMAVTFLRQLIPGTKVAATSNALPDRLGEGRFHADDFRREIAAIASHFEVVRVDGPDYRRRALATSDMLDDDAVSRLVDGLQGPVSVDEFDPLLGHLRLVHPVRFAALLDGLDAVVIRGLHPIPNQGDALLFAHLVDELYDAEVTFAASGCTVDELFPKSYRGGGYRKKYGRCESRLSAMLAESRGS